MSTHHSLRELSHHNGVSPRMSPVATAVSTRCAGIMSGVIPKSDCSDERSLRTTSGRGRSILVPGGEGVRDAPVDVVGKHGFGAFDVALEGAFEQRLVLVDRLRAAVAQRIAEIFVEHDRVALHQLARTVTRDESLLELA